MRTKTGLKAGCNCSMGRRIRVRKVVASDRKRMLSIINSTENLNQEEMDCALELLDTYLDKPKQKDYLFLAAVDSKDSVTGYVCFGRTPLTDSVYDLYWIVVAPECRRMKIGEKLLAKTEQALKKEGARILVAETSSLPSYDAARAFYSRSGYKEEARVKDFYKPGDDLVVFVKRFAGRWAF